LSKTEWRTNQVSTERASSKQAVTVATPTVATISFAAATSSHDPNPILQSSDLDSDKTRSALYPCSQTPPQRAELRRAYVAWVQKLSVLDSSGHFNCPRTGVLVRRLLSTSHTWSAHPVVPAQTNPQTARASVQLAALAVDIATFRSCDQAPLGVKATAWIGSSLTSRICKPFVRSAQ